MRYTYTNESTRSDAFTNAQLDALRLSRENQQPYTFRHFETEKETGYEVIPWKTEVRSTFPEEDA